MMMIYGATTESTENFYFALDGFTGTCGNMVENLGYFRLHIWRVNWVPATSCRTCNLDEKWGFFRDR